VDPRFLHALSLEELTEWVTEQHEPAYRAKQIMDWVWNRHVSDPALMSNLSLHLRERLACAFCTQPVHLVHTEESADKETTKFLWRLHDEKLVESVLIRAPGRCTLCVSSQVGCPVRCVFCASGKNGFVRNLHVAEIVGQVLSVSEPISNIVYMGMGEPLRNYEAVVESIRRVCDSAYGGMSRRRITVSTVGVVENIRRLADEGVGVNLALSLHAPTQEIRQKIIPYAKQYPLEDVLEAVDYYRSKTGRDVTYEYILLSGVTDRVEDAEELCALLAHRQGCVNLIPYNPVAGLTLERPSTKDIERFRAYLDRDGIVNTCRYTKGQDIAAACGQLVLKQVS
jgi:23S rRNA (adenine2503-C2)-methyltransferase